MEKQTMQEALMDQLSEMAMLLEHQGFHINAELEWKAVTILVRMDYISRIMDNISSNLIRYAEPADVVSFQIIYESSMAGIEICNRIKHQKTQVESTKVGVENIKRMMNNMGGTCQTEMNQEFFKISILFSTIN